MFRRLKSGLRQVLPPSLYNRASALYLGLVPILHRLRHPRGWFAAGPFGLKFANQVGEWGGGFLLTMRRGSYEAEELDRLLSVLKAGDHVVEIGGGLGYISCHIARLINSDGRLGVVEPALKNVHIIRRNLALNGFNSVQVLRAALGYGMPSIQEAHWGWSEAEVSAPPPMLSLEAMCSEFALSPTHLVLDCEGAERDLFRLEAGFLSRLRPVILAELHPEAIGVSAEEIVGPLQGIGYECRLENTSERTAGTLMLQAYPTP